MVSSIINSMDAPHIVCLIKAFISRFAVRLYMGFLRCINNDNKKCYTLEAFFVVKNIRYWKYYAQMANMYLAKYCRSDKLHNQKRR